MPLHEFPPLVAVRLGPRPRQLLEKEEAGCRRSFSRWTAHANGRPLHDPSRPLHAEKRSAIAPAPNCPLWRNVWSQQTRVRGGGDGTASSLSAHSANPLMLPPDPPSSAVFVPMVTSTASASPQPKRPNPASYFTFQSSNASPVLFAHKIPVLKTTRQF